MAASSTTPRLTSETDKPKPKRQRALAVVKPDVSLNERKAAIRKQLLATL